MDADKLRRAVEPSSVEAVLLDSGDTLVHPLYGTWWPKPALRRLIASGRLGSFTDSAIEAALGCGMEFLQHNHFVRNLEEEVDHFRSYYRFVFDALGIAETRGNRVDELANAAVYEPEFSVAEGTRPLLKSLAHKGFVLGILSDAWPSLERRYETLGLRDYFRAFVISAQVGCLKPETRIFLKALEELGARAEKTIFVDDDPDYARAARELGMRGIWFRGTHPDISDELPSVANLRELEALMLG